MHRILVTGVGAIIGYGIVRSLRKLEMPLHVIGMDIFSDAVGQHWCDNFVQARPAAAEDYTSFLLKLIEDEKIDLVIPGIEQDIARMLHDLDELKKSQAKFVINHPELIRLAADKWHTHRALQKAGISTIKTYIEGEFEALVKELGLPFLLKPRRSYASKGIFEIADESDFKYWKKKLGSNFMVQEIVGDDDSEFTVGVFGYGDGSASQQIVFQRRLSGEGATSKARVRFIPELEAFVEQLVQKFKPLGPTNFQFRRHAGHFLLLEINPRISSSTSLRTAFGFNEAEMCIDYFLEGKKPGSVEISPGQAMRYIDDLVVYDSYNC